VGVCVGGWVGGGGVGLGGALFVCQGVNNVGV
jgi:hypothetical protein